MFDYHIKTWTPLQKVIALLVIVLVYLLIISNTTRYFSVNEVGERSFYYVSRGYREVTNYIMIGFLLYVASPRYGIIQYKEERLYKKYSIIYLANIGIRILYYFKYSQMPTCTYVIGLITILVILALCKWESALNVYSIKEV